MRAPRVWVSGIGLVTPIGSDPESFWDALIRGTSGVADVRSFDTSSLPNRRGCEVHDPEVEIDDGGGPGAGRCTQLGVLAARRALASAGLDPSDDEPTALVVGTTMGEVTRFEQDRILHADREPDVADVRSLALRPLDAIGRTIAARCRLNGPVLTVPAACAAGSYAVGIAASMVARGEVARALAVGCEAFSRLAFVGFSRMRAMSSDCCRPFSRDRPGLLLGEGAAGLLVESETAGRARGASALGLVESVGLSCDAHHVTAPHPDGDGAVRAMRQALERAGLQPGDIDYVNAHGTGTPLNDRMEARALRTVFGPQVDGVPVSSIKALTGHMMGAAGAVEAVASLLALRAGVVPPTWNWLGPDPDCAIDCVPNEPRSRPLTRVLSNSYAFGGNNASLVLGAAPGA